MMVVVLESFLSSFSAGISHSWGLFPHGGLCSFPYWRPCFFPHLGPLIFPLWGNFCVPHWWRLYLLMLMCPPSVVFTSIWTMCSRKKQMRYQYNLYTSWTSMFNEYTFLEIPLPSSGWEKYLSKRSLITHTCSSCSCVLLLWFLLAFEQCGLAKNKWDINIISTPHE